MSWVKKWETPQEYIKYKRSLIGRYDLENDCDIKRMPPMIPAHMMGTKVYGADLGVTWDQNLAVQEIELICQRCRQQTIDFVREIRDTSKKCKKLDKLDQVLESITNRSNEFGANKCTPFCTWWDYFQAKRDNAYIKFNRVNDDELEKEIDNL